jgi:hypothetical protein
MMLILPGRRCPRRETAQFQLHGRVIVVGSSPRRVSTGNIFANLSGFVVRSDMGRNLVIVVLEEMAQVFYRPGSFGGMQDN